jgi:hypothetical protein
MDELNGVIVRNIPFRDLETLSESVKKYAGVYMLTAPSGGAGTPAVDAHCLFPSLDDAAQFKFEWARDHD